MARIIRTTPTTRKTLSLRVIFSFLLFMQIQMPDAREMNNGRIIDLSFYLAAKETPQISLSHKEVKTAEAQLLQKCK